MEQYCSKRGHRQYLKRGGGCSNLTILRLLWSQRCLLSEELKGFFGDPNIIWKCVIAFLYGDFTLWLAKP